MCVGVYIKSVIVIIVRFNASLYVNDYFIIPKFEYSGGTIAPWTTLYPLGGAGSFVAGFVIVVVFGLLVVLLPELILLLERALGE